MAISIQVNCMVITPLTLNLDTVHLTDEQFYQLCQNNRELNFERTAKGELIIMAPVGGDSGNREANLIIDLGIWNRLARPRFHLQLLHGI